MKTKPDKKLSISKTDYKVARSCAAKLYYRMNKYPSTKDDDEYIELLAEGGYMIGAIASLLFADAVLVDELDHGVSGDVVRSAGDAQSMEASAVGILQARHPGNGDDLLALAGKAQ